MFRCKIKRWKLMVPKVLNDFVISIKIISCTFNAVYTKRQNGTQTCTNIPSSEFCLSLPNSVPIQHSHGKLHRTFFWQTKFMPIFSLNPCEYNRYKGRVHRFTRSNFVDICYLRRTTHAQFFRLFASQATKEL